MIKDVLYKIWNIFISSIKFISLILFIIIVAIIGIGSIATIIIHSSPTYVPCTASAFNFLALGSFAVASVFIIGILSGLFGKNDEDENND